MLEVAYRISAEACRTQSCYSLRSDPRTFLLYIHSTTASCFLIKWFGSSIISHHSRSLRFSASHIPTSGCLETFLPRVERFRPGRSAPNNRANLYKVTA